MKYDIWEIVYKQTDITSDLVVGYLWNSVHQLKETVDDPVRAKRIRDELEFSTLKLNCRKFPKVVYHYLVQARA